MSIDLIIRGGEIHDGTGAPGYVADIGVSDGRIVDIGQIELVAREEIDARGKVVTPGFVDIHTHYDGQVVWDDTVAPSSRHGVTTALMGNCGVGFAPCKPEDRSALVELMEGVEDIPSPVLHQGLTWQWESFPEYLDVVERTKRDIDVAALMPHAPLRVYVMGKRALKLEPANADDIALMRSLVAKGMDAGAFGISTSRTTSHTSLAGDYTPTLLAREREIMGLMLGMQDAGHGLLEVVTEMSDPDLQGEYEMLKRVVVKSGRSAVFSLLQNDQQPDLWRELMKFADDAIADGIPLRPVVAPRPIGLLLGLEGSQNPFSGTATYRSIAHRSLQERVEALRDRETRARILFEDPFEFSTFRFLKRIPYTNMFPFGDPPNYTPKNEDSIASIAEREGRTPPEVAFDLLLENDGMSFIYVPFANYTDRNLDACEEMLANPNTIMGLGDGGAHVGFILDAGFPTWLLTYWVRDRGAFGLPEAVRRLTSDTADVMGLTDRGRLEVGLRADINVIDFERVGFGSPYVTYDLPSGGKRLMQDGIGYDATLVAGEITYRDGEPTGAKPGTLLRATG